MALFAEQRHPVGALVVFAAVVSADVIRALTVDIRLLRVGNAALFVVIAEGDGKGDPRRLKGGEDGPDGIRDQMAGIAHPEGGMDPVDLIAGEHRQVGLFPFQRQRKELDGIGIDRRQLLNIGDLHEFEGAVVEAQRFGIHIKCLLMEIYVARRLAPLNRA